MHPAPPHPVSRAALPHRETALSTPSLWRAFRASRLPEWFGNRPPQPRTQCRAPWFLRRLCRLSSLPCRGLLLAARDSTFQWIILLQKLTVSRFVEAEQKLPAP